MRISQTVWMIGAVGTLALAAQFAKGDEEAPRPRPVETETACEQVIDKTDIDSVPECLFIADADALADYWESTEFDMGEKPELEFEDSIVVIEYRDAADPNQVRYMGRVNNEGELEVIGMSTLMGFQQSTQYKLTFLIIPREGVTAVVRRVRQVDDDGAVTFERVVFLIEADTEE